MIDKPINNRAWFFVLPVLALPMSRGTAYAYASPASVAVITYPRPTRMSAWKTTLPSGSVCTADGPNPKTRSKNAIPAVASW